MLKEHPDFNLKENECITRFLRLELTSNQVREMKRSGWDPEEYLFEIACREEPHLGSLFPFRDWYAPAHGLSEPGLGIVFYDKKLKS